jgi:hypothetical protein
MVWQNGERWSASSANIPGQRILSVRISVLNVNPTPGMRLEAPSTGSLKRNNPCLITPIAKPGRGRFYPVDTQYRLGIAHFSHFFPSISSHSWAKAERSAGSRIPIFFGIHGSWGMGSIQESPFRCQAGEARTIPVNSNLRNL